jgi:NAD(P)-dependent dehydrogenase (short-subunit alcohol dehydrogenase family)
VSKKTVTPLEKARFDALSTTSDVLRDVNLSGRLVVVTGGGGGLGKETARSLAAVGADVVIGGRSPGSIAATREELAKAHPASLMYAFSLDLASTTSVDAFADSVLALNRPIDIFIANAGIMAAPLERNADGYEMQFATNFLGHALLTSRFAPALRRSGAARVVILTSSGHHFSSVDLEDLNWHTRSYDKWLAYGQSKTACSLLAVKVGRALAGAGVTSLAVHPGFIRTELMRYLTQEDYGALRTRTDVRTPAARQFRTVEQGAATSVWAATAPELEGRVAYLEDCAVARPVEKPDTVSGVLPYALDPTLADNLWVAAERLIRRQLPL